MKNKFFTFFAKWRNFHVEIHTAFHMSEQEQTNAHDIALLKLEKSLAARRRREERQIEREAHFQRQQEIDRLYREKKRRQRKQPPKGQGFYLWPRHEKAQGFFPTYVPEPRNLPFTKMYTFSNT